MTIYISHSKKFDYLNELYQPLRSLADKYNFIFPHENSASPYPTRKLFLEKKCDLVLAEVSQSATGQGIELGWADLQNIPIVCLYKKGSELSGSLKLICAKFFEYSSAPELIEIVKTHILPHD